MSDAVDNNILEDIEKIHEAISRISLHDDQAIAETLEAACDRLGLVSADLAMKLCNEVHLHRKRAALAAVNES